MTIDQMMVSTFTARVDVLPVQLDAKWSTIWETTAKICAGDAESEEGLNLLGQQAYAKLEEEGNRYIDEAVEKPEHANNCLRLVLTQSTMLRIAVPSKYGKLGGEE